MPILAQVLVFFLLPKQLNEYKGNSLGMVVRLLYF